MDDLVPSVMTNVQDSRCLSSIFPYVSNIMQHEMVVSWHEMMVLRHEMMVSWHETTHLLILCIMLFNCSSNTAGNSYSNPGVSILMSFFSFFTPKLCFFRHIGWHG